MHRCIRWKYNGGNDLGDDNVFLNQNNMNYIVVAIEKGTQWIDKSYVNNKYIEINDLLPNDIYEDEMIRMSHVNNNHLNNVNLRSRKTAGGLTFMKGDVFQV